MAAPDIIKNESIIVIDDDDTASEIDDKSTLNSINTDKKRKAIDVSLDKVVWTDESDDARPVKPKKRKAKRKSIKKPNGYDINDDEPEPDDETALASIPDYVHQRRQEFDAKRRKYHESALLIPPDYSGIDLDDNLDREPITERPQFDTSSGIRPSRSYQDIDLPQSGGIIPAPIAQYLRDYQVDGVKFLHKKFVYQDGAILGDDMGLGKTVQVAAFLTVAFGKTGENLDAKRLRHMRQHTDRWYPRILIVCPGSLLMNWRNELNRWGWWHVDVYHGANKDDVLGMARAGRLEIMITTYDTYKNGRSAINMVKWDAVIADECHRLKDRHSETTKAMNEVNALCRIGLTGTAIQNKYEELWTLLDWTNPGQFGTKAEWTRTVSKPLAVGQSHEATNAQLSVARQTAKKLVQNLLPRYFLRRMKTLIAHQLPKKTDRVVFCPLTEYQAAAYENFLESDEIRMIREISDVCEHGQKKGWCCGKILPSGKTWQSVVFPSMITLQKLANHLTLLVPMTTDIDEKHKNELNTLQTCLPESWKLLYEQRDRITNLVNPEFCGKWKVLKKLLKFWHSNGDKVLVFSHSVRLLKILAHLFTNTSYSVSYLDGSLKYEERQDVVDTFNSDPTQFVFLISTKAGGVGLNITSANKVVIIDPHWNPSYDLQAQDRAYRIGQTRDVEVFRLISLGTVEEIVYARQIYKQQQANIGYTASSERRYFRGVQQDSERKGEIFGLPNIFTYHKDSGLLRDIVNKTNIAEAKAGVNLVDVNMEQAAKDEEDLAALKKEEQDDENGGMSQLAALLTAEDQQKMLENRKSNLPKSDAIQAILTSAGVDYTHDNAQVIGSSKVEEQLSKRAELMSYADGDAHGQSALFGGSSNESSILYNPPDDVCLRQFCEMAREFGFVNAREFALIVESWSQEARTNCLDKFYKRAARSSDEIQRQNELADEKEGVKSEPTNEIKDESFLPDEKVKFEDVKPKLEDGKPEPEYDDDIKPSMEDLKPNINPIKMEASLKGEAGTKHETPKKESDDSKNNIQLIKTDQEMKLESGNKRTSIFLIDDDDDDDEL